MTNPNDEHPKDNRGKQIGIGMGLGIALGMALGVAMRNIPLGLVIGIIIGGLGVAINRLRMRKGK